jgi:triphosphoribosyl-dephospho-CoA synthase
MARVGLLAQVACLWEATARKPGNVHRYCDFSDVTYLDFALSAAAIAPVLDRATERRVGETILDAVRATRQVVGSNTNLGIILLLAPLTAVPESDDLRAGLVRVLDRLDVEDARLVYEAIRLARPGGLGQATQQDVADEPTLSLHEVMALAAERDLVARQYAIGFREVFDEGVPALLAGLERAGSLEGGIVLGFLHLLAIHPDSLVARKCGPEIAAEASRRTREVLEAGWPASGWDVFHAFDAWLRADGNRRNPGTTADLTTACLFVSLRQGRITLPSQLPWSAGPASS